MSRLATPRLVGGQIVANQQHPKETTPREHNVEARNYKKLAANADEAALGRRGNAAVRADLKDAHRLFDPGEERQWGEKYHFFSNVHMKSKYKTHAKARHDPFNKDPAWGRMVIANVASACKAKGVEPQDLFKGCDLTGDGSLNRPEMKKILLKVLPTLSDMELATIFDVIDKDSSGEVQVNEFCEALVRGRGDAVRKSDAERWRNPMHRITRFPPAKVEGWDHLEGATASGSLENYCEAQSRELIGRVGDMLIKSPRALKHTHCQHKYHFFGGGGYMSRFEDVDRRKQYGGDAAPAARQSENPKTGSLSARGTAVPFSPRKTVA